MRQPTPLLRTNRVRTTQVLLLFKGRTRCVFAQWPPIEHCAGSELAFYAHMSQKGFLRTQVPTMEFCAFGPEKGILRAQTKRALEEHMRRRSALRDQVPMARIAWSSSQRRFTDTVGSKRGVLRAHVTEEPTARSDPKRTFYATRHQGRGRPAQIRSALRYRISKDNITHSSPQ